MLRAHREAAVPTDLSFLPFLPFLPFPPFLPFLSFLPFLPFLAFPSSSHDSGTRTSAYRRG